MLWNIIVYLFHYKTLLILYCLICKSDYVISHVITGSLVLIDRKAIGVIVVLLVDLMKQRIESLG